MPDQGGEGVGQDDRFAAQPDAHLGVAGLDLVEGEAAGRGRGLGVEEYEQAGDPVFGFDGVVVQQAAGLFPTCLGVDDTGRAAPPGGGEVQLCQLLPVGPTDEVACVPGVGRVRTGQPRLEIALPGGGEGQPLGGEPVEQNDAGLDVPSGGDDLAVGGAGVTDSVTQPPQDMPSGVAVQQLLLIGGRCDR